MMPFVFSPGRTTTGVLAATVASVPACGVAELEPIPPTEMGVDPGRGVV